MSPQLSPLFCFVQGQDAVTLITAFRNLHAASLSVTEVTDSSLQMLLNWNGNRAQPAATDERGIL